MHQDISNEENGQTGLVLVGVHVQRGHETLQFGRGIVIPIKSDSAISQACCTGLPVNVIHEIHGDDKWEDDGIDEPSQLFLNYFLLRSQLGEVDDFLVRHFDFLPHRIMVMNNAFFSRHVEESITRQRYLGMKEKKVSAALKPWEKKFTRQADPCGLYTCLSTSSVGESTWITQLPSMDYPIMFSGIERKDQGSWR